MWAAIYIYVRLIVIFLAFPVYIASVRMRSVFVCVFVCVCIFQSVPAVNDCNATKTNSHSTLA